MKFLSEFSSPTVPGLTTKTFLSETDTPVVEFYRNNQLVETRSFPNKTLQYAEDAAENFCLGIDRGI